jgi:putative Mg2+ transporter-C (MgtC) family protein
VIPIWDVVLRVCLATVLGGLVGVERERSERAAGLRTHAMVGLGAAVFMIISAFGFGDILGARAVVLDPSRVAAQIVTGIGFLGAGTIIFQREMVRGLTTAASIWAVAAIGAAVGGGMWVLAGSTTALTLGVLAGLKPVENRWFRARHSHSLSLLFDPSTTSVSEIESVVERDGYPLDQIVILPRQSGELDRVDLIFSGGATKNLSALIDSLRRFSGVRQIGSAK